MDYEKWAHLQRQEMIYQMSGKRSNPITSALCFIGLVLIIMFMFS